MAEFLSFLIIHLYSSGLEIMRGGQKGPLIDTALLIQYLMLSCTPASNRAVLLLVVEEERTVRKPADKVITPVLLDNPVLSHVDVIPKTRLLYQLYCINKL